MVRSDQINGLLEGARIADKMHKAGASAANIANALRKKAAELDRARQTEAIRSRAAELLSWLGP